MTHDTLPRDILSRRMTADIESHTLVSILNCKESDKIIRFSGSDVPDDTLVHDAIWNPLLHCWSVVLIHPSFEAIPEGALAPSLGMLRFVITPKSSGEEPK